MANVAILYGGRSGEHEVSLASAASVLSALSPKHSPLLIGIDHDGIWYRQERPIPIPKELSLTRDEGQRITVLPGIGLAEGDGRRLEADVVLPILHGSYGEDGTLQGLLEMARLPYAGAGVLGSALGMDKDITKRIWRDAELPVVPWYTIHTDEQFSSDEISSIFDDLGDTVFVKPANAGSSVGVSKVENHEDFDKALAEAAKHDRKVLVEKAVDAREIECSVMGYSVPKAFPPGEVIPAGGHGFYDYDAKYLDPDGALLHVPADIPPNLTEIVKDLAIKAYRAVNSGGLSRVDFLLEKNTGKLYLNEINTLPGMTSVSLFPRMAAAGGLDFTAMVEELIQGALSEAAFKNGLSYTR